MTGPHLTAADLQAFAAAELSAVDLARVDTHLATCRSCAGSLADMTASHRSGMLAAVTAARRRHLSFEEMEAIVHATPLDDDLARAHLSECESCRLEVEDLRTFASTFTHDEQLAPAAVPPRARETPEARSFLATLAAWMRTNPGMLGLAGAIAVVTLLVTLPATRSRLFPGSGPAGSGAASIRGAQDSLGALQTSLQLPDARVARLRQILSGATVPGPAAAPTEADRDLLARAERAQPDTPLVLGALAQDLGLVAEAERFYRQALASQPDSPEIMRLLDNLPRR
jgi:hypothetical protein